MKKSKLVIKEEHGQRSNISVTGEKPREIKIAYIGGGSRGWAHALIHDLALCTHFSGEVALYDIDHPMAEFNAKYGNWMQTHPKATSNWNYCAEKSLARALAGADFVFMSIMPGPMEFMRYDLELPEKYGIFHSVGDTVGLAGHVRALRSVKIYRQLTGAIAAHAPRAWILNFTNPMTVCTRTIYRAFPAAKAYGCCHEVFGAQALLAGLVEKYLEVKKPGRQEIDINVVGINHFTWVNKAQWRGVDLFPLFDRHLREKGTIRTYTHKEIYDPNNPFVSKKQVMYELYKHFGIMPAAGDRHLAEFVPWFITSRDSCTKWGFVLTPYSYRIKRYRQAPKDFKKQLNTNKFPELWGSGEEYINQMLALTGKSVFKTNVNLPNAGQIANAPLNAVVETNALFSNNHVEPIAAGAIPEQIAPLILPHIENQENIIKAVWERDKDRAFRAFLNEPLNKLSIDNAWKLYNEMLDATKFEF